MRAKFDEVEGEVRQVGIITEGIDASASYRFKVSGCISSAYTPYTTLVLFVCVFYFVFQILAYSTVEAGKEVFFSDAVNSGACRKSYIFTFSCQFHFHLKRYIQIFQYYIFHLQDE